MFSGKAVAFSLCGKRGGPGIGDKIGGLLTRTVAINILMIAISRWLWVVVSLLVGVVRCKVEDGDPYASYAESYADAYADYYGNDEEAAVATAAVPRIATESYLLLSMDAHGCQRRRYTGAASGEKGLRTDLQRMEDAKRQAEMRMRGMSEADMALEGLGGAGGAVVDAGEGYGYDDDDGGYYYGDEDGGYGYGYAGEEEEEAGEGKGEDAGPLAEARLVRWRALGERLSVGNEMLCDVCPSVCSVDSTHTHTHAS